MIRKSILTLSLLIGSTVEANEPGLLATVYLGDNKTRVFPSEEVSGVPVGEFLDYQVPVLSYTALDQEEAAKKFFRGTMTGIQWNGFINAGGGGDYSIVVSHVRDNLSNRTSPVNGCSLSLKIDDEIVLEHHWRNKKSHDHGPDSPWAVTRAANISLTEGEHPISIWMQCGVAVEWNRWVSESYKEIRYEIDVKGPGDRIAKAPETGFFYFK